MKCGRNDGIKVEQEWGATSDSCSMTNLKFGLRPYSKQSWACPIRQYAKHWHTAHSQDSYNGDIIRIVALAVRREAYAHTPAMHLSIVQTSCISCLRSDRISSRSAGDSGLHPDSWQHSITCQSQTLYRAERVTHDGGLDKP
jgi:hypothetical protein